MIVPPSFLFQYSMAVPLVEAIPRKKGSLLQLDDTCRMFVPGSMNDTDHAFGLARWRGMRKGWAYRD
jgi:hypothetical protein